MCNESRGMHSLTLEAQMLTREALSGVSVADSENPKYHPNILDPIKLINALTNE